jgi:multiple sugar transport system permease protein
MSAEPAAAPVTAPPRRRRPRPRTRGRGRETLRALPWIGPVLVLIVGVVFFPAGYMIWTSTRELSRFGVDRGFVGLENFADLLAFDPLPRVFLNTVIWVVGVVGVTVLVSLGLAQFLSKAFPGRTVVRIAVIIPWAASVVMTSTVFLYALDPFYGIANKFLVDVGILDQSYGFTRNHVSAFVVAMVVAIFVSLPFTTYTLLSGLQTIPAELVEAAQLDGASRWHTYRHIVLPLLRPAIAVATIINIINVFNSLPILEVITGALPGYSAETTTTLIFELIRGQGEIHTASALSVLNFVIVLVVIGAYLRIVKPMRDV